VARTHSALQAFGLKLRQLREEAGLNGKQLAERLRWQPSKLSRVENGKQTVSPEDLAEWADGLGVSTPIRDGLLAELHDSRLEYATWKQQLAAGTFDRQHASLRREAGATSISVFESAIVPGLLQTPEYARHVLTGVVQTYGTTDDVDAGVRARIERQAALYDPTKRWRFLMTEAVLLYRLAPAQIMLAQLDRLTMLAGLDSVEIRIVPFTARYVIAPWNGCFIFDDDTIEVETISAELTITDPAEIVLYRRVYDAMWESGLAGNPLRELLQATAEVYRIDESARSRRRKPTDTDSSR